MFRRQYILFSWICLLSVNTTAVFGQKDSAFLSRTINLIKTYSEKTPVEKVYLQLDKGYYAAGDDIWFKAYVTAGSRHELSGISGVLNVELINSRNLVEQYIKLPLVSGLTWGDFKLPDTLHEGNYRVRAYTNWMRNAGTEYFYDRRISIGNAISQNEPINNAPKHLSKKKQIALNTKPILHKCDVQFFPESGNLVYGINSKVAFKAVGEDGFGKDIKGVVFDDQNQEITRFTSGHSGMGVFNLLPVNGKTYKAQVTYPDGTESKVDLPNPLIKGYVLHINNADPLNIIVQIEASRDLIKENANAGINIIAQSGNEVYYAATSNSISSSFNAVIPKSRFPSGITQFTLFSSRGEPLNERLVFIQNPDQLKLSLTAPEKIFTAKEKMKISIGAENEQDKPALGNFSVAVVDETKARQDETAESTIFSNLLLTSEIKGYVENPNYYFNNINEKTREDLDILMLTQGYHRFEWKQILAGDPPPILYQPESSLELTGHLKTLGGKPVAKGKVSLLSSSAGFFMLDTTSDNQGYFAFKNLQFKDSTKFVVQSKTTKGSKNLKLTIDSISLPITSNKYLPVQSFTKDSLTVYLENSRKTYTEQVKYGTGNHSVTLKEVKITAKKPVLKNSSNLNGPGQADQVLLFNDKDTNCPSIAECLIGKLTGVFFKYDYGKGYYYPCTYEAGKSVAMKIMVDGILLSPDILNTIPPDIIESVEVLRSGSFTSVYNSDGYNGLILINTKKGFSGAISTPNTITYMPKGYYKARVFYSPQYDDPKTNAKIADLRTTVYWNPNIATNKDGEGSFEYFNADGHGTYRLVIEGIDEKGNIGRQVYRYKVE